MLPKHRPLPLWHLYSFFPPRRLHAQQLCDKKRKVIGLVLLFTSSVKLSCQKPRDVKENQEKRKRVQREIVAAWKVSPALAEAVTACQAWARGSPGPWKGPPAGSARACPGEGWDSSGMMSLLSPRPLCARVLTEPPHLHTQAHALGRDLGVRPQGRSLWVLGWSSQVGQLGHCQGLLGLLGSCKGNIFLKTIKAFQETM